MKKIQTDKMIILLISSIFIIPFLPLPAPSSGIIFGSYYLHDISAVFIASITCLVLISRLYKNKQLLLNPSHIFLASFCIFILLQIIILKSYISYSLEAAGSIIIITTFLILLYNSPISKESILNAIANGILISVYIQIIICILQLLNIHFNFELNYYSFDSENNGRILIDLLKSTDNSRISGSLSQPNNLADLLCWGIFANIYKFGNNSKFAKIILIINSLTISTFISLTYSRTAIAFAIFMLIYGTILIFKSKKYSLYLITHSILLLIVISLANHGYLNNLSNINKTDSIGKPSTLVSFRSSENTKASDNQRLILLQRGWQIFTENPIIGAGWQYFGSNVLTTDNQDEGLPQFTLPMNAHNLFIQLLATTGIIGFLIVCFFIVHTLYKAWKQTIQQQILLFGISIIVLLHSMVEYPLFYLSFLYCFLIITTASDNQSVIRLKLIYTIPIIMIFIIGAIWQVISGINNFLILSQLKRVDDYIPNQPLHNIISKFDVGLNPLWSYYVDADFAYKISITSLTTQSQPLFNLEYQALKKVEKFSPFPIYVLKLAIIEELKQNKDCSKQLIKWLLYNFPNQLNETRKWLIKATSNNVELQNRLLNYLY